MMMLLALLDMRIDISFLPMYTRSPRYEANLAGIGIDVLSPRNKRSYRLVKNGNCVYNGVVIARRAVAQRHLKSVRLQCPDIPIIYDTGKLVDPKNQQPSLRYLWIK